MSYILLYHNANVKPVMIGKKIRYFAWRNAFEGAQNWMRNKHGWKKKSPGQGTPILKLTGMLVVTFRG